MPQQEVEEEEEENDNMPQQEVNRVVATLTTENAGNTLFVSEDESLGHANGDLSPRPSQGESRSHGDTYGNNELNSETAILDEDDENRRSRSTKRKRLSSSSEGLTQKKHKHNPQQRSPRLHRVRSKSRRHSSKACLPHGHDHALRATVDLSTKGRLPSPAPSTLPAINTQTSSDYSELSGSSSEILPTLVDVTFRPQSPNCCSFTAVVREGCDSEGVSFSQLARLIESIGHVGKIDDSTIKPLRRHFFLLTGISRHALFRLSSSEVNVLSAAKVGSVYKDALIRPQDGRSFNSKVLTSPVGQHCSSDDDGELSDCDPEPSSDDDECSSEDEPVRSTTKKNIKWEALDEQRLLAYKKEGKSWEWIFKQFSSRTRPAIRTRWNMIRP